MKELLITYWVSVVLVILFIIILIGLWKKGKKEQVKFIIYWFVAEAEKKLGNKSGKYKYGMVIDRYYNNLPFIMTLFFTKKEVDDFIEKAVVELKDYLSAGNDLEGIEKTNWL